jgi:hypothetical protein
MSGSGKGAGMVLCQLWCSNMHAFGEAEGKQTGWGSPKYSAQGAREWCAWWQGCKICAKLKTNIGSTTGVLDRSKYCSHLCSLQVADSCLHRLLPFVTSSLPQPRLIQLTTPTLTQPTLTLPAQHSTAPHSTARHSTAQHGTAQHGTAQHGTARHSTAQHGTARHGTAQHGTARHSTAQHGTSHHCFEIG